MMSNHTVDQKIGLRHARGVSLIEVLVSILLMTLTLVGVAGLLGKSTQMQLGLESRSAANLLMSDLANRIRASFNTAGAATKSTWSQHYSDLSVVTQSWSDQQTVSYTPGVNCASEACNFAELADYDVSEIRRQMARTMPQPALFISGDAASGMRISFAWFDKDATRLGTDGAVQLETSPTCTSTDTGARALSCCPTVAAVASTPGVRCLNLELRP